MDAKQFESRFTAQKIGLLQFVQLYPLEVTWEFLVQKCDTIMPRYYTIASSALKHP